jgi:hypothetical protein
MSGRDFQNEEFADYVVTIGAIAIVGLTVALVIVSHYL